MTTTNDLPPLTDIEMIKGRNASIGNHFFSPDTMRFFSSKVLSDVFPLDDGGAIFVTSERAGFDDYTREWTLRRAEFDGTIGHYTDPRVEALDTYEEREAAKAATRTGMGAFSSARSALTAARKLAESLNRGEDLTL